MRAAREEPAPCSALLRLAQRRSCASRPRAAQRTHSTSHPHSRAARSARRTQPASSALPLRSRPARAARTGDAPRLTPTSQRVGGERRCPLLQAGPCATFHSLPFPPPCLDLQHLAPPARVQPRRGVPRAARPLRRRRPARAAGRGCPRSPATRSCTTACAAPTSSPRPRASRLVQLTHAGYGCHHGAAHARGAGGLSGRVLHLRFPPCVPGSGARQRDQRAGGFERATRGGAA